MGYAIMPSTLNKQQLADFKKILKQRYIDLRREISQELASTDQNHFIDLAEPVHDLLDASVADLLVDLNLASIDRHIQEIRDIDAALIRIAQQSYGVCDECSDPIPDARLTAYPTAKRCLHCQARYEQTHAHPSQSSL